MDEEYRTQLDEQLQQLAIEAQQHPPKSKERRLALTNLIEEIRQSGRICRPRAGEFPHVYQEIYEEATQNLFLYISVNIDKYDPQRSPVMVWVNFLLKKQFFNEAISFVIGNTSFSGEESQIENLSNPENAPSVSELLRQHIEEDSENVFRNKHINNHPKANFQALAIRRLQRERWQDISADLGIKVSTLSDFYQRCLKELAPKIQEDLQK